MEFAFIGKINQTNSIISEILQSNFDAAVSFYSIMELLQAFPEKPSTHPQLIIFDLNTNAGLGKAPENIQKLAAYFLETPILVIHPYRFYKLIQPLIHAGAKGLISVTPARETIIEAVQQLLNGNEYLPFSE